VTVEPSAAEVSDSPPAGSALGPGLGAARIAGAATLIAALTVVARLAGFGRIAVFNVTVGTTTDLGGIYQAANTVPNIIFELVAGGALASLVVPLLAGGVARGDRRTVAATTSALLTWVVALLLPAAALVAVFAGPIVRAVPAELTADQLEVAARMLRVFAPQLPLYGIGIVLTGVLQAHHRFAWPVIAPLLSSVTVLGAYTAYALADGRKGGVGGLSGAGELFLAGGTTLGVVILSICLVIPLRRLGLRLRPTLAFPGDTGRRAVRMGWAGAVTVGTQQVALLLTMLLALQIRPETYTQFVFAQTMFLLPWAVLAVPLATAAYPTLAAAHAVGDHARYDDALAGTARSLMLLACLGAAALGSLARPVAVLLDATAAAPGIVGFAPGLLGYALFALLSRALYARGATKAAAAATAAGWAVAAGAAFALSAALPRGQRVFALGLANAVGMSVIGLLLALAVRRLAGPAALAGLGRATTAGAAAAVTAGLAGWGAVHGLGAALGGAPAGVTSLLQGMLGGVVVAAVFAVVAYALDRHDVRPLAVTLRRRLPGGRRTAPTGPVPDREETP
jgi:putative peptidoglycan lipid II flippase